MRHLPLPIGSLAVPIYAVRVFRAAQLQVLAAVLLIAAGRDAGAQLDPVKRQLIQIGYTQQVEGRAPLSGYAFYYANDPDFFRTNYACRLALAPVYLDTEIGVRGVLSPYTDFGLGLAGGGFAESYAEIRRGRYLPAESFLGHNVEGSVSLYHLLNPGALIPLNLVLRGALRHGFYDPDDDTAADFALPPEHSSVLLRAGLRWGGQEPLLFPSLAMELSAWYEAQFRDQAAVYGFGDRELQNVSHHFWGQALLAYTLPGNGQYFRVSATAGTSLDADRLNCYRLGALLPLASEFPLALPGYFYQELSSQRFALLGASYLFPLDRHQRWSANLTAATAYVDYLPGLEQPGGRWHSGVAGGVLFSLPGDTLKVLLVYAYGVDAIRGGHRGAQSVSILIQLDLKQARGALLNPDKPGRWRGWQRIFGG